MKKLLVILGILLGVNFNLCAYDPYYVPSNEAFDRFMQKNMPQQSYSNNIMDNLIYDIKLRQKIRDEIELYHMMNKDDFWNDDCDCKCY